MMRMGLIFLIFCVTLRTAHVLPVSGDSFVNYVRYCNSVQQADSQTQISDSDGWFGFTGSRECTVSGIPVSGDMEIHIPLHAVTQSTVSVSSGASEMVLSEQHLLQEQKFSKDTKDVEWDPLKRSLLKAKLNIQTKAQKIWNPFEFVLVKPWLRGTVRTISHPLFVHALPNAREFLGVYVYRNDALDVFLRHTQGRSHVELWCTLASLDRISVPAVTAHAYHSLLDYRSWAPRTETLSTFFPAWDALVSSPCSRHVEKNSVSEMWSFTDSNVCSWHTTQTKDMSVHTELSLYSFHRDVGDSYAIGSVFQTVDFSMWASAPRSPNRESPTDSARRHILFITGKWIVHPNQFVPVDVTIVFQIFTQSPETKTLFLLGLYIVTMHPVQIDAQCSAVTPTSPGQETLYICPFGYTFDLPPTVLGKHHVWGNVQIRFSTSTESENTLQSSNFLTLPRLLGFNAFTLALESHDMPQHISRRIHSRYQSQLQSWELETNESWTQIRPHLGTTPSPKIIADWYASLTANDWLLTNLSGNVSFLLFYQYIRNIGAVFLSKESGSSDKIIKDMSTMFEQHSKVSAHVERMTSLLSSNTSLENEYESLFGNFQQVLLTFEKMQSYILPLESLLQETFTKQTSLPSLEAIRAENDEGSEKQKKTKMQKQTLDECAQQLHATAATLQESVTTRHEKSMQEAKDELRRTIQQIQSALRVEVEALLARLQSLETKSPRSLALEKGWNRIAHGTDIIRTIGESIDAARAILNSVEESLVAGYHQEQDACRITRTIMQALVQKMKRLRQHVMGLDTAHNHAVNANMREVLNLLQTVKTHNTALRQIKGEIPLWAVVLFALLPPILIMSFITVAYMVYLYFHSI